ncbi:MAG: hypothetical protein MUQ62_06330 [Reinekea forsetii]|nr:hypothetical protein [Reinekea forsetii]
MTGWFRLVMYLFGTIIPLTCFSEDTESFRFNEYFDEVSQSNVLLSNAKAMQGVLVFKNQSALDDYKWKYEISNTLSFTERILGPGGEQAGSARVPFLASANKSSFSISERSTFGTLTNLNIGLTLSDGDDWANSETISLGVEQSLAFKRELALYRARRDLMIAQSRVIESDQQRIINAEYQRILKSYLDSTLAYKELEFLGFSKSVSDMELTLGEVNYKQGVIDEFEMLNLKIKNKEFEIEFEDAREDFEISTISVCSEYQSSCPNLVGKGLEMPYDLLAKIDRNFNSDGVIGRIVEIESLSNNISNINATISSLDVGSSVKIFASYSVSSVDLSESDSTWSIGASWRYKFDSKEKRINEISREIEFENSKESLAREARLNFNSAGVFEQITRKRKALALKNEKLNLTKLLYDSKEKMKFLGVLSDFELLKEEEKIRGAELEVLKNQVELTYQYITLLSKAGMALDIL